MSYDAETELALDAARALALNGVPVFPVEADAADPSGTGYALPGRWDDAVADVAAVDAWRPGMGLVMVTGHGVDLVDVDARKGAVAAHAGFPDEREVLAWSATPSGGVHLFVSAIGEASRDGAWPGVDVKAGRRDGTGRGLAFLPPTVRASKVDGIARTYRWGRVVPEQLAQQAYEYAHPELIPPGTRGPDPRVEAVAERLRELRRAGPTAGRSRRVPASVASRERARVLAGLPGAIRGWAETGWGGEAHAGLLAATTWLARIDPEGAQDAYLWAFAAAGVEPDEDDLRKLESALEATVPDEVVPDEYLEDQEAFLLGGEVRPEAFEEERWSPSDPTLPRAASEGAGGAPSEGRPARGRYRLLDEFEMQSLPRPDALVAGALWTRSVARLFGASGAGKSWVALDLAAHVACGMPWQGREVKQQPVVYVAAEGAPGVGPRMAAWRSFHGRPTQVLCWPEAVTIGGPDWSEFVDLMVDHAAGLVLFDTQSQCTVGYGENSNDDAALLLRALGHLVARTGACALLVHHVGNDATERARGATALYGGLDTELRLDAGRDAEVRLWQTKQKYAERERHPTRLRLVGHDGQLVVAAHAEAPETIAARASSAWAHVAALEANHVDSGKGLTALVRVLRDDLGRQGDEKTMRDAVYAYKHRCGVAGVHVPGYLLDAAAWPGT